MARHHSYFLWFGPRPKVIEDPRPTGWPDEQSFAHTVCAAMQMTLVLFVLEEIQETRTGGGGGGNGGCGGGLYYQMFDLGLVDHLLIIHYENLYSTPSRFQISS